MHKSAQSRSLEHNNSNDDTERLFPLVVFY